MARDNTDVGAAGDRQLAAHELLREAEALARLLRLATDGHLTLGVLDNGMLRDRSVAVAFGSWHAAHEAVGELLAAGRDAGPAAGPGMHAHDPGPGMHAHDGLARHSHEVRADHLGVPAAEFYDAGDGGRP